MVDAITTQVVRNHIASLMEEMHYHFYRSGYSTIIRKSRDFSCVILDRHGGLIVAPPMFFHAPVYRHLVGNILQRYGDDIGEGDMFVSNHPYEGGLPHVSDMAFVAPILSRRDARRLCRLDRPQGRCRRHHARLDLGQRHRDISGGPADAAGEDVSRGVFHADLERLILANSRQPELVRGDMHAQIAVTQMGAGAASRPVRAVRRGAVMRGLCGPAEGRGRGTARGHQGLPDGEASAEGFLDNDGVELDRPVALAVTVPVERRALPFDFSASDPQANGPVNLRPSMVEACVFYSLIGCARSEAAFQRRHARRGAVQIRAEHRHQCGAAGAGSSNYQMVNLKLVDVILEALAPFRPQRAVANAGSSGALMHFVEGQGRPGQSTHAIRNPRLGLRRRQGQRRRLGDRDPLEQSAHHADRDSANPSFRAASRGSIW